MPSSKLDQLNFGTADFSGPQGYLFKNVLVFGRLLRDMGVNVNPGQMMDYIRALQDVGWHRRDDVYFTGLSILVNRIEQILIYDQAFDLFWRTATAGGSPVPGSITPQVQPLRAPPMQNQGGQKKGEQGPTGKKQKTETGQDEDQDQEIEEIMTYSPLEILRKKDFEGYTWEEIQQAKRLMQQMAWRVGERPTRRKVSSHKGRHLDLRRVMRRNLKYGGIPMELSWRERKYKRRPLVVLCDISGSMERYTRIFLQFIHTISNGLRDVESFVFGTRLTRISRYLKYRDIDVALSEVSKIVQDFSGGTRIGESMKQFNYEWGRRVLGRGAVVLIISDGWDRGDTRLLSAEMERLQRSCYRLIWLNPLLGTPGFQPLTQGLQAALPYVDDFLPVHNLESLESLAERLSVLDERRPQRRQSRDRVHAAEGVAPGISAAVRADQEREVRERAREALRRMGMPKAPQ
ncbi:MAG: VWA domain-containing protein [Chloroflexi bacterium]|nr:VWA domain-containing protein [Chloroflexota bacterium]